MYLMLLSGAVRHGGDGQCHVYFTIIKTKKLRGDPEPEQDSGRSWPWEQGRGGSAHVLPAGEQDTIGGEGHWVRWPGLSWAFLLRTMSLMAMVSPRRYGRVLR